MDMIDKKTEQTLLKVADYENNEKRKFSRRVCGIFVAAIIAFLIYSVLEFLGLASTPGYAQIASYSMGIVFGALLVGALYTSRYIVKIQAFKRRLLCKLKKKEVRD